MAEQQEGVDKRTYPRISREVSIEVKKLEYPLAEGPGESRTTKDIAVGGLRFTAPSRCEPGAVLSLKIELRGWRRHRKSVSSIVDTSAAMAPLTAIAEVVWAKASSTRAGYDIGVKFINIYGDDLDALKKYLSGLGGPL